MPLFRSFIVNKRNYPGGKAVITPISRFKDFYHQVKAQKTLSLYQNPAYLKTSVIGINNVMKSRTILCPPMSRTPYKPMTSIPRFMQDQYIRSMANLLDKKPLLDKPITLINNNNVKYETKMTPFTKEEHLTEDQVIEELKKRGLVKDDSGHTTTSVILQDDSTRIVGCSKHNVKLSPIGQASVELQNAVKLPEETLPPLNLAEKDIKNILIILPPKSDSSLLLETGKQKHLLVAVDHKGDYYSFGYLTSKKNSIILSEKQFKKFQNEKEDVKEILPLKIQGYVAFNRVQKIDLLDIHVAKWGTEYLNFLDDGVRKILIQIFILTSEEPTEYFDKTGISKKDCIEICQKFDIIAVTKGTKQEKQHPISLDQQKQNAIHKEAQKQKNNIKKDDNSIKQD
jgi:hypothetical protein